MLVIFKKIWVDPVGSKVLGSSFFAIFGAIVTYFTGLWPAIIVYGGKSVRYAVGKTEIPNWLLCSLGLCTSLLVVLLFIIFYSARREVIKLPKWISYTSDNINGLKWRWNYGEGGTIYGLKSYCPRCDLQINGINNSGFVMVDHIVYYCEHCATTVAEFSASIGAVENLIERVISKNTRSINDDEYSP
jgi:hypothetical protein